MRIFITLNFIAITSALFAQPYPTKIWDKRFGGLGHDQSLGCVIKQAKDGNILFVAQSGYYGGDLSSPGKGGWDYWLFKVDTLGNLLWEKGFGGNSDDNAGDFIELDDGGFLIGGGSYSSISGDRSEFNRGSLDYWIIRTDANLNKMWDKAFGGTGEDRLESIVQTPDKGFLLAGSTRSQQGFDVTEPVFAANPNSDFWLVRVDSMGNKLWDRRYGWTGGEICYSILAMPDGNFILFGYSDGPEGGHISQPRRASYDFWVLKIDPLGNKIWDKRYGGTGLGAQCYYNHHSALTSDSGFIFGGWSSADAGFEKSENSKGVQDYWVIKCDSAGNIQWDKTLGGTADEYLGEVAVIPGGGYLVSGFSKSQATGDKTQPNWPGAIGNRWSLRLRDNGTTIWDVRFGGSIAEDCHGALALDSGIYISFGNSMSDSSGDKTQNNWNLSPGNPPPGDIWLVAFTDPPLGYENMGDRKGGLDVFPNPFREILEVGAEFSKPGKVFVDVFDITGRKVYENNYSISTNFFNKEIDLGFLKAGVYSLAVTTASEKRTRLVVKK